VKRQRLYVDTSVWNFLFEELDLSKRAATERFFEHASQFDLFISELVLQEIERCEEGRREQLYEKVRLHTPAVLVFNEGVESLASIYVTDGVVPERYRADALHIAFTTVYDLDAIVSWNLEHIVKTKTRRLVTSINVREGFKIIDFATPEEVI